jgi:hypothetical protein
VDGLIHGRGGTWLTLDLLCQFSGRQHGLYLDGQRALVLVEDNLHLIRVV